MDDKFRINMKQYCREYEESVRGALAEGEACPGMLEVHREKIREVLGEKAVFAPAHLNYLRPAAAGVLAMESGEKTDYLNLEATYLRPPNAQKNKKLLEAMGMKQE